MDPPKQIPTARSLTCLQQAFGEVQQKVEEQLLAHRPHVSLTAWTPKQAAGHILTFQCRTSGANIFLDAKPAGEEVTNQFLQVAAEHRLNHKVGVAHPRGAPRQQTRAARDRLRAAGQRLLANDSLFLGLFFAAATCCG
jgi:hypothetical protein